MSNGDSTTPHYDAIALGAGPANLSLAALFRNVAPHSIALFDGMPSHSWHARLLHPGVKMQTSWMKDLVSLVDPTHPLSFMNYLVSTGRVYGLLNAQYSVIPRREYELYLGWASAQLPNVHHGVWVERISYDGSRFVFHGPDGELATGEHLVVATGTAPYVPPTLSDALGDTVFVADDLAARVDTVPLDARIAVVGGGQTGAEAVVALLSRGATDLHWFGRRPWFSPIDDSPTANDYYRPAYLDFLQGIDRTTRRDLVEGQTLTADAITPGMLQAIYQANYEGMLVHGRFPLTLYPGRDVVGISDGVMRVRGVEQIEEHRADVAVLATGRRNAPLPFDEELRERIEVDADGELVVGADFAARWKDANGNRIYVQNRSRHSHGILDANLTLLPVRSAAIINSMFEHEVYTVRDELTSLNWG